MLRKSEENLGQLWHHLVHAYILEGIDDLLLSVEILILVVPYLVVELFQGHLLVTKRRDDLLEEKYNRNGLRVTSWAGVEIDGENWFLSAQKHV